MDLPLIIQILAVTAAAGGGAVSEKVIKAIRGGRSDKEPEPASAQPLFTIPLFEDSISEVNARISNGFLALKQQMNAGFSRLDNLLAGHREEFADLTRRVDRIERSAENHVKDHDILGSRVVTLEEWRRASSK